jgi:hypothetical protein
MNHQQQPSYGGYPGQSYHQQPQQPQQSNPYGYGHAPQQQQSYGAPQHGYNVCNDADIVAYAYD